MKKLLVGMVLALAMLTPLGCLMEGKEDQHLDGNKVTLYSDSNLDVIKIEDKGEGVICYVVEGGYKGGISCLHKDIVGIDKD